MSIEMYKGDDRDQPFVAKQSGVAVNLTSAKIWFTVKETESSSSYLMQLRNTAAGGGNTQVEVVTPGEGKFTVHIPHASTELAKGGIRYYYDVQIEISGKRYTAIKNRILFAYDITT